MSILPADECWGDPWFEAMIAQARPYHSIEEMLSPTVIGFSSDWTPWEERQVTQAMVTIILSY